MREALVLVHTLLKKQNKTNPRTKVGLSLLTQAVTSLEDPALAWL